MNSQIYSKTKRNALYWLILNTIFLAVVLAAFSTLKIESNISNLLNGTTAVPAQIEKKFNASLNNSLLWLVGEEKLDEAIKVADELANQLSKIPLLENIVAQNLEQEKAWQQYLFQYRSLLINPELSEKLTHSEDYFQGLLSQIYSPFSGISSAELQQDPLLLIRQSLLQAKDRKIQSHNGWLYVQHSGKYYALLRAEILDTINNADKTILVENLNSIKDQLLEKYPQAEIYNRGNLFFSQAIAKNVEKDIQLISVFSIIGICILLFFAFRSLYSLLLLSLSLVTGLLWGLVATYLCFGEIHLLTIALSTSLVGVSADYSLHFLTERFLRKNSEKSYRTLEKLKPTLLSAFITTILAYSILYFAPLAILKQMAVYAVFGLSGAIFTIFTLYPLLTDRIQPRNFKYWLAIQNYLNFWKSNKYIAPVLILLTGLGLYFFTQIKVSDDVRLLQSPPADLQHMEHKISDILKQNTQLQYFIVQADTDEKLLQNIELLFSKIDKTEIQSILKITDFIPSFATQHKNKKVVENAQLALKNKLLELGVENIKNYNAEPISLSQFFNHPVADEFKRFYHQDKSHYFIIPLSQSNDLLAQEISQQISGVSYHNMTQDWTNLFDHSRTHILNILFFSFIVVFIFLTLFLNWRYALAIVGLILFSMLMAIATLSLTGQYFNLFSALALILILGIGVDYGIFLAKNRDFQSSSFVAIILSGLTTQLSFGLLMLSSTTALVSFATVLCVGISCAFLLAPVLLKIKKE